MHSAHGPQADGPASDRPSPSLVTLAPRFDSANHGVYRDLIIKAIEQEPSVTNLALTGAYGVGKSSVLRDVSAHYRPKVVELSLASLAAASVERWPETAGNPTAAATTPTNRIQREIVKQLLYRLPPSKTPQSRFPRAMRPEPSLIWSAQIGTAVFALVLGTGLATAAVELTTDRTWQQFVAYVCLYVATVGVVWLLRANSRRLTVDSVSAGPAKVTLSQNSTSYFDEYLDEIVYFFEVSGCEVVLFEDIDRFGDPHIFETLRALNTLLNGSEQLNSPTRHPATVSEYLLAFAGRFHPEPGRRKIVFIYAIHDGIFERLADIEAHGESETPTGQVDNTTDLADLADSRDLEQRDIQLALGLAPIRPDRIREEVERANRTKFFDLVIPIVPFITANNARDVLKRTMGDAGRSLKPELIKLVAAHLADMRLVLNIRNEFEVYRRQLYDVPERMHGLTEDRLFALIVYKNTHLGDFEAIRLQSSRLDSLYRLWRRLVNSEISAASARESAARSMLDASRARAKRGREFGAALMKMRDRLAAAANQSSGQFSGVFLDANQVDDDAVRSPEFWRAVAAGSSVSFGPPGNRYSLTFAARELSAFLNLPFSPSQWLEPEPSAHDEAVKKAQGDVWFLRHHTWMQLYAADQFTVAIGADPTGNGDNVVTFRQLTERVIGSKLACDLVREGFIDENFALYVSTFYGDHVRPAATEYIMRCVRAGEPDAAFLLDAADVDAIISEEGDAVLSDPSMYNVSILDHLLGKRLDDASAVVDELLKWGDLEHKFFDSYIAQGAHPDVLVRLAAPKWPRTFTYLATESPAAPEPRIALFDVALRAASAELAYSLGAEVRDFIDLNYAELQALAAPADPERAHAAFAVVAGAGSMLTSTGGLSSLAKQELIERRSYQVSGENLASLSESPDIALDILLGVDERIYAHAVDHLGEYVDAARESKATKWTVSSPRHFVRVLTDIAQDGDGIPALSEVIELASPQCGVSRLQSVPPASWAALCASTRAASTFGNIRAYIDEFGAIDDSLATLLRSSGTVDWRSVSEADRIELATAIANASSVLPGIRVRTSLIRSLGCQVPASALEPSSDTLVANLLRGRLITDDADAFTPRLMTDWPTLEAAIKASKQFESFVSPAVLPARHIASLLTSEVRQGVKTRVVSDLPSYLSGTDAGTARRIAEALVARRWRLTPAIVDAVRASGARPVDVVRLLGQAADRITVAELRSILRGLPTPYSKIADPEGYRPSVPDDEQHRAVLDRLVADRVVKSHKPDRFRKGYRKVSTYRR